MIWSHREDLPVGCTIVGDPQHDCINLAKVLHFHASDKENLMEDHAETMHRLAAPDYPVPEHDVSNPPRRNGPGRAYALPVPERQLSKEAVALLWSACIDPWPKWQNVFQHSTEGVIQEAKNFLTLPRVQECKAWLPAFKGFPPRRTLGRIAKRFGADLHPTCQPFGFESEKEFRKEIRRIMRWYKHGKKSMRKNRNLPRKDNVPEYTKGLKTTFTKKVRTHFRRLLGPIRQEGLWAWRAMSRALRKASICQQSLGYSQTSLQTPSGAAGFHTHFQLGDRKKI